MDKIKLQNVKGTRDFLPEEKIARDNVVSLLKENLELYGYNPLETPALEPYEVLASKYAGGAEILKEVYTLKDNADRKLGLRYDLTVPLARVMAMNPNLKKPFKRYQIDRIWRDGPIKLGRYREFWQCDADVIGVKSMLAEAELLTMTSDFFNKLGLDVIIYVNNRKLMNAILDYAGISKNKQEDAILVIDKLKKIGIDGIKNELKDKKINEKSIEKLLSIFKLNGSYEEILEKISSIINNKQGIAELNELFLYCNKFGLKTTKLDISLARGLSYYTGTVFEVFIANNSLACSLAAGGRFDKMIGDFIGSEEELPAVGISFGLDTILDVLDINKKIERKKSNVKVYVIPIKTTDKCISILKTLRGNGIKCDMDFMDRNITKNLDYADKLGIPYVMILGDDELDKNKVKLKNMKSGAEEVIDLKIAIEKIVDKRVII